MNITDLKDQLPEYAKDVKLNLSTLIAGTDNGGLTDAQVAGTALACAYATRHPTLIEAVHNHARAHLSDEAIKASQIAAALMAMNNVYYRFVHLASDKSFATLPAKLRMNSMANPGVDKVDFELYALAISALNGCGMCIDSHIKSLQKHGVSNEAIQTSVRIAAILSSVAQVLVINPIA